MVTQHTLRHHAVGMSSVCTGYDVLQLAGRGVCPLGAHHGRGVVILRPFRSSVTMPSTKQPGCL